MCRLNPEEKVSFSILHLTAQTWFISQATHIYIVRTDTAQRAVSVLPKFLTRCFWIQGVADTPGKVGLQGRQKTAFRVSEFMAF